MLGALRKAPPVPDAVAFPLEASRSLLKRIVVTLDPAAYAVREVSGNFEVAGPRPAVRVLRVAPRHRVMAFEGAVLPFRRW